MHIYSFGFRHGLTLTSDAGEPVWVFPAQTMIQQFPFAAVVDVRRMLRKNPYHNRKLRGLRGDDPDVIANLRCTPHIDRDYAELREELLRTAKHLPWYIGCAGGHHRSVYIADRLAKDTGRSVTHLNYNDK